MVLVQGTAVCSPVGAEGTLLHYAGAIGLVDASALILCCVTKKVAANNLVGRATGENSSSQLACRAT